MMRSATRSNGWSAWSGEAFKRSSGRALGAGGVQAFKRSSVQALERLERLERGSIQAFERLSVQAGERSGGRSVFS